MPLNWMERGAVPEVDEAEILALSGTTSEETLILTAEEAVEEALSETLKVAV